MRDYPAKKTVPLEKVVRTYTFGYTTYNLIKISYDTQCQSVLCDSLISAGCVVLRVTTRYPKNQCGVHTYCRDCGSIKRNSLMLAEVFEAYPCKGKCRLLHMTISLKESLE